MKPEFLEIRNTLEECPKCGKHSLAQCGCDKYRCLWCGFYRDISQPEGGGMLLIATIFAVVLIGLLANQTSSSTNKSSSPDASNFPAFQVSPDERSLLQK